MSQQDLIKTIKNLIELKKQEHQASVRRINAEISLCKKLNIDPNCEYKELMIEAKLKLAEMILK